MFDEFAISWQGIQYDDRTFDEEMDCDIKEILSLLGA
jgi:hypothetical protein